MAEVPDRVIVSLCGSCLRLTPGPTVGEVCFGCGARIGRGAPWGAGRLVGDRLGIALRWEAIGEWTRADHARACRLGVGWPGGEGEGEA